MLTRKDGAKGLNFLSPQIFEVVKKRMNDPHGTIDHDRLLRNMLSSQPMCFNLFGPMVKDVELTTRLFKLIIPIEFNTVEYVTIEHVLEPASEYLNDKTAFDAFVELSLPGGRHGFVGIETKLTEPFSQSHREYDDYKEWIEKPDSPWRKESWGLFSTIRYNQLWRDHLLAVALKDRKNYEWGFLMLVRHPLDTHCSETKDIYCQLLKQEDYSFLDLPLDECNVEKIHQVLHDTSQKRWLDEFKRRYLDLSLSEKACRQSRYP